MVRYCRLLLLCLWHLSLVSGVLGFVASWWCSFCLIPNCWPVSPIYTLSQSMHGMEYTTPDCSSFSRLSLGCTSNFLRVMWGLMAVQMLCFRYILSNSSDIPLTYGITTRPLLLSCFSFLFLFFIFVGVHLFLVYNPILTMSWSRPAECKKVHHLSVWWCL